MSLQIAVSGSGPNGTLVRLTGEVDHDTTLDLAAALNRVLQSDTKQVVVDLSAVTFINSSGVGALLEACARLESRGGELTLTGARGAVQIVLDMLGLSSRIRQTVPSSAPKSAASGASAETT
jgi:stage II sporulation protein AA (anti-sigma F factor antagonist)